MNRRQKVAAIITFIGISGLTAYVYFGTSDRILALLILLLLFSPAAYLTVEKTSKFSFLFATIAASSMISSLWIIGSGYVQGTDGPHHVSRARLLLSYDSFDFPLFRGVLSEQAPVLYILTNEITLITTQSIYKIQLLFPPIFSILSILLVYTIITRVYNPKHAKLTVAFLITSMTFIGYSIQIRTSSLGIIFLLFVLLSFIIHSKHKNRYSLIMVITLTVGLYLSHIATSMHLLIIGSIIFVIVKINRVNLPNVPQFRLSSLVIAIILFFTILIYVLDIFHPLIFVLQDAFIGILRVDNIMNGITGRSSGGGDAAGGTGAGSIVFVSVWLARGIFVISALIVTVSILRRLQSHDFPLVDSVILTGSAVYLCLSLSMLILGDQRAINPERIYRYFEFFAAIVIARGILIISNTLPPYTLVRNYSTLIIVGVILMLVIGSVAAIPVWTLDTGLRDGGELPYNDYSSTDVALAKFADDHVRNDSVLYGDSWNSRLHNAYGGQAVYNHQYYPINSEVITSSEQIHFEYRYNQRQYLDFSQELLTYSDKMYDNGKVSHYRITSDYVQGNITYSDNQSE